tara:strand:+ start:565 stop:828 length:264 start_codon:yes stop_codon:yes gene_type:complete
MSELDSIKDLIATALIMVHNIDVPTTEEHGTMAYVWSVNAKLREAGVMVHALTPDLSDMIQFVHEYVPEQYHGVINHAWSGIGDWQA